MNAAAKLICEGQKFDHVTEIMRTRLHWLPVECRVKFKLCLLTYKALHGEAPQYLAYLCVPVCACASRHGLRSAAHGDLRVLKRRHISGTTPLLLLPHTRGTVCRSVFDLPVLLLLSRRR
jgi:hypothetical protein